MITIPASIFWILMILSLPGALLAAISVVSAAVLGYAYWTEMRHLKTMGLR